MSTFNEIDCFFGMLLPPIGGPSRNDPVTSLGESIIKSASIASLSPHERPELGGGSGPEKPVTSLGESIIKSASIASLNPHERKELGGGSGPEKLEPSLTHAWKWCDSLPPHLGKPPLQLAPILASTEETFMREEDLVQIVLLLLLLPHDFHPRIESALRDEKEPFKTKLFSFENWVETFAKEQITDLDLIGQHLRTLLDATESRGAFEWLTIETLSFINIASFLIDPDGKSTADMKGLEKKINALFLTRIEKLPL